MTLCIAFNTFREAARQKLIAVVALIALALVAASRFLLDIDLGHDKLRFIFDFSAGTLDFFGAIIAVVCACNLFASEFENKTVITMLSKAVGAREFVAGKTLGAAMVLAVFTLAIALVAAVMLRLTEASLGEIEGAPPPQVNYSGFAAYFAMQWLKLCMCAAVAAFICSASRSFLFSVSMSFLCILACAMAETVASLGGGKSFAVRAAAFLLPDFQLIGAARAYVFAPLDFLAAARLAGYSAVYILACVCAGTLVFAKRDF